MKYNKTIQREAIQEKQDVWKPSINVPFRSFALRDPSMQHFSPVQLFLAFIQPIFDLLYFHTNIVAQRLATLENPWKVMSMTELRCWCACRIRISKEVPQNAEMYNFWVLGRHPLPPLSRDRYKDIEHYLSMESESPAANSNAPWFWRIETACNTFR